MMNGDFCIGKGKVRALPIKLRQKMCGLESARQGFEAFAVNLHRVLNHHE